MRLTGVYCLNLAAAFFTALIREQIVVQILLLQWSKGSLWSPR